MVLTDKQRENMKQYYQSHKDIIKARTKLWKINNKERKNKLNREYKKRHKEQIAIYEKNRRQKPEVKDKLRKNAMKFYYQHKDIQINKMKKWRSENSQWFDKYRKDNKDKISKYQVEYNNRTPQNIMTHRLRTRLQTAMRLYSKTGKIMKSRKYGIDYKKIIEHLKPFPEDLSKYHIDHITPLCSFNLNNQEEIKTAFLPENHQWLLIKDNLSKGSKLHVI